jgi:hypothetical protein
MGRISQRRTHAIRWVPVALLLFAVAAPAAPASQRREAVPPGAQLFGQGARVWAADWWQWALTHSRRYQPARRHHRRAMRQRAARPGLVPGWQQVAGVTRASGLFASIDGAPVRRLRSYLERSVRFSVVLPDDNVFGVPELGGVPLTPCVDAGFHLDVRALRAGRHTIRFRGRQGDFAVDVTYRLIVRRRG